MSSTLCKIGEKFTNTKSSLFAQNIRKEVFSMKINKQKKAVVISISYLSAAVIALGILAGTNYQRAETYKRYVAANYQHAFGELVTAVSEMDTALQKSLYATSPSMVSTPSIRSVCSDFMFAESRFAVSERALRFFFSSSV